MCEEKLTANALAFRVGASMKPDLASAFAQMQRAPSLALLLDYDGTLRSFTALPDGARPDTELLEVLADVAARPSTYVHVVSGRSREVLEAWLGALAIGLHAEHGFWSRMSRDAPWVSGNTPPLEWKTPVLAMLERTAARVPGAIIEEKASCVAWHYRNVERAAGLLAARELTEKLTTFFATTNADLEVLVGDMVVEVRLRGIHKGHVVPRVLARHPGAMVVAVGDDVTDEDLFEALPKAPDGVGIHVGEKASRAALRVASPVDVRAILRALATNR
jgi:trehalose 6-phosphate synthase/phosphatase